MKGVQKMKQCYRSPVALLGGGLREEALINRLLTLGFPVKVLESPPFIHPKFMVSASIEALLEGALILLAPASGIDEDSRIKESVSRDIILDDAFLTRVQEGAHLFIGTAETALKERLTHYPILLVEYLHLAEIAVLNAVPTAEAALALAMERLSTTLQGCQTLVTGLGRVGLALCRRLQALHALVWGANRSPLGRCFGTEMGVKTIPLEEMDSHLSQFSLIFNTIPAPIFSCRRLALLQKEVILIDLASAPGGVDFDAADRLEKKASLHPGLPGRYFPLRAGEILAETLPEIMEEKICQHRR